MENQGLLDFMESQNGLSWKDLKAHPSSNPNTFCCPRVVQGPSNLALDIPGMENPLLLWEFYSRASPPSQGKILPGYLQPWLL